MNLALTIAIDGVTYASWLFIVALGLTLVFGVLKILNIAHGSFYALGAYVAASLVALTSSWALPPLVSLLAMLVAALAVAALVAPLIERGLLRFFYGRDEVLLVLVTYAMFLMMEDITKLIWGANPYYVSEPYALFGNQWQIPHWETGAPGMVVFAKAILEGEIENPLSPTGERKALFVFGSIPNHGVLGRRGASGYLRRVAQELDARGIESQAVKRASEYMNQSSELFQILRYESQLQKAGEILTKIAQLEMKALEQMREGWNQVRLL